MASLAAVPSAATARRARKIGIGTVRRTGRAPT
jgi:hypothetical protein